jgi:CheY-like chemotaxis protein
MAKILTVDDSKMVRMIVGSAFGAYDCQVLSAENGAEGLEIARREKPDIIFLDITMPVMDGLETLGKIRSDGEISKVPVVMLTAESDGERLGIVDKLHVSCYIAKPFKGEQLVEVASKVVALNRKSA